jgi:DNA mismatch endonuclease (patch repair protein)
MPDIFSKEKRSEIMSKIRSKGTKIELKMKAELDRNGLKYEYQPKLFGKPDFLIPPNIVVFCDSSFWHGRNWKKLRERLPDKYWYEHIKRNVERDKIVTKRLREEGYVVFRFWDNQIEKEAGKSVEKIKKLLEQMG